jgi:hypothetical protein
MIAASTMPGSMVIKSITGNIHGEGKNEKQKEKQKEKEGFQPLVGNPSAIWSSPIF